jgi:hypothetical protein
MSNIFKTSPQLPKWKKRKDAINAKFDELLKNYIPPAGGPINEFNDLDVVPVRTEEDKELDELTKKFYKSKEWKALRETVLEYRNTGRCRNCQVMFSNKKWQEAVVDHILPLRLFPEYGLEINNLQLLCNRCNYAKASHVDSDAKLVLRERRDNRMSRLKKAGNNLEISYMKCPVTLPTDKTVRRFLQEANEKRNKQKLKN